MNTNEYIEFKFITIGDTLNSLNIDNKLNSNIEHIFINEKNHIIDKLETFSKRRTIAFILVDFLSSENTLLIEKVSHQLKEKSIRMLLIVSEEKNLTQTDKSRIGNYGNILLIKNQPFYKDFKETALSIKETITILLNAWNDSLEYQPIMAHDEKLDIFFQGKASLYLYPNMNIEKLKIILEEEKVLKERLFNKEAILWLTSKEFGKSLDFISDTLDFIEENLHEDTDLLISKSKDLVYYSKHEKIYNFDFIICIDLETT